MVAKTFVYVSNAQDGNIDAYTMDTSTGSLTPIGTVDAGKLVMPMAVSPDKEAPLCRGTFTAAAVLTYAIDPTTGALTQKASAAASREHALCLDRSHRALPVHRLLWRRQNSR